MSFKDRLDKSRQRAISDMEGTSLDTEEAVKFVVKMLRDKSFAKTAIEVEDYISQALAVTDMMEKWEGGLKYEILKLVGENDEGLVKILPVYVMARALQNFDKRRRDGK